MRIFLFFLLFAQTTLIGQTSFDSIQGKLRVFDFNYGLVIPMADLGDRFGSFSSIGLGYSIINKNDLQYGLNGQFFYGNKINEDVLSELRGSLDVIIGADGRDAVLFMRSRGIDLTASVAKIMAFKKGSRSGLKLGLGIGFTAYKIRIQDDSRSLAQTVEEYLEGYDRMVSGPSANQFIGYQRVDKSRRFNFFAGLNIKEAFTKHRRNFNFRLDPVEANKNRLDLSLGFQVGLMLVFNKFEETKEIYY